MSLARRATARSSRLSTRSVALGRPLGDGAGLRNSTACGRRTISSMISVPLQPRANSLQLLVRERTYAVRPRPDNLTRGIDFYIFRYTRRTFTPYSACREPATFRSRKTHVHTEFDAR